MAVTEAARAWTEWLALSGMDNAAPVMRALKHMLNGIASEK